MINHIDYYLKNPDDLQAVPQQVKDYLKARYNLSYLMQSGELQNIRKKYNLSEEALLGFIIGLEYAAGVLEEIDNRIAMKSGNDW